MDPATTRIVSMVYSQTQILEQEVYLVEQLGKKHEAMNHLKALVFIQPTEHNIDLLVDELKSPQFSEYHIFFSNVVGRDMLSRLATADEREIVRQVQEYYADFLAINDDLFHLGIDNSVMLSSSNSRTMEAGKIFRRNVDGILSLLLAVKRRPTQIRYQSTSDVARRIASDIVTSIEHDEIYDFRRQDSGLLLLILDRKDDPCTPLLTQWTYQAMVHELLGLTNNRVLLKEAPGIQKDLEEIVLSVTSDPFFARHRNSNFGDLGTAVRDLLLEYQKKAKVSGNMSTIEEMQAFMEKFPQFKAESFNVSKHVALMGELARLVDVCQLLNVSQLEQDITCTNDHNAHKRDLMEMIASPTVKAADKLRLSLLYLIKYESYGEAEVIKKALSERNLPPKLLALVDAMLDYAGESKRAPGLFSGGGFMQQMHKTLHSSLHGVDNVYTQHVPVLSYTLESVVKGKIKEANFPLVFGTNNGARVTEVVVFIVGGATYEEATKVAEMNATPGQTVRIILGGSCVQNSTSFLNEINNSFRR